MELNGTMGTDDCEKDKVEPEQQSNDNSSVIDRTLKAISEEVKPICNGADGHHSSDEECLNTKSNQCDDVKNENIINDKVKTLDCNGENGIEHISKATIATEILSEIKSDIQKLNGEVHKLLEKDTNKHKFNRTRNILTRRHSIAEGKESNSCDTIIEESDRKNKKLKLQLKKKREDSLSTEQKDLDLSISSGTIKSENLEEDSIKQIPENTAIVSGEAEKECEISVIEMPENSENVSVNDSVSSTVSSKDSPEDGSRSRYGRLRRKRPMSPVVDSPPLKKEKTSVTATSEKTPMTPPLKEDLEKEFPCMRLVGDLVWSKLSIYPWWPCMITFDPVLGIYTRIQGSGTKFFRTYHVQFFGKSAQRGWIAGKNMMTFEGRNHFENYIKSVLEKHPPKSSRRTKLNAYYKVKWNHRRAWEIAVVEAEDAFPLSRAERKLKYTFEYEEPKPKPNHSSVSNSESKRTNHSSVSPHKDEKKIDALKNGPKSEEKPPKKRKLSQVSKEKPSLNESTISTETDEKPSTPKKKSVSKSSKKKQIGNFSFFLEKHSEQLKEENPELNAAEIEEYLRKQWDLMSIEQKLSYRPRFTNVPQSTIITTPDKTSSGNDANKRPRKPSKKLEEADVNCMFHSAKQEEKIRRGSGKFTPRKYKASSDRKSTSRRVPLASDLNAQPETDNKNDDNSEDVSEASVTDKSSVASEPLMSPISSSIPTSRSNGEFKTDRPCQICEKPGDSTSDLIKCDGVCYASFHLSCIGLTVIPAGGFKCDECISGVHSCFICKVSSSSVRRCTTALCGRFYHEDCLKKYPVTRMESKTLICPLHVCVSCAANNPKNPWATKSRLMRCIRCPTAYHQTESCLGAGSKIISPGNMICPLHFKPSPKSGHINVNWCFICSSGGQLICCESCPASFHAECLEIEPPEGSYYCADCTVGQQPKYGDIVWVKLGCYRWWPAEVCNWKNVPDNIQAKEQQPGEFPVHFFGSRDYYWSNRSRVFTYQEGDKGSKEYNHRGIAKVFKKALEEAAEAYQQWKIVKANREAMELERSNQKPPPYKQIKTNKPVGKVQIYTADPSELTPCECDPNSESPCSSDTECLNRMLMFECHPAVCAAGDRCCNQRFQKRQYPLTVPFRTDSKGWGLKTLVDIKKGEFVNEYVGEVIGEEECRRRMKKMHDDNAGNFYFLTIDKDRIIDAGPKGNLARYMNHSCQPNCETQKWTVNGDTRVGLFAICDIPAGAELNFNYNLDCLGYEKNKCQCGAENCSGYIGVRPKQPFNPLKQDKNSKENMKKKMKRKSKSEKIEHEDECFRCYEGGELVMCDRKNCPKAYHLKCLNREKPPRGKWDCPWHHCDVCGRAASRLCDICPNSFCYIHMEGLIKTLSNGKNVCHEHPPESDNQVEESLIKTKDSAIADKVEVKEELPIEDDKEIKFNEEMKTTDVAESLKTGTVKVEIDDQEEEPTSKVSDDSAVKMEELLDAVEDKVTKNSNSDTAIDEVLLDVPEEKVKKDLDTVIDEAPPDAPVEEKIQTDLDTTVNETLSDAVEDKVTNDLDVTKDESTKECLVPLDKKPEIVTDVQVVKRKRGRPPKRDSIKPPISKEIQPSDEKRKLRSETNRERLLSEDTNETSSTPLNSSSNTIALPLSVNSTVLLCAEPTTIMESLDYVHPVMQDLLVISDKVNSRKTLPKSKVRTPRKSSRTKQHNGVVQYKNPRKLYRSSGATNGLRTLRPRNRNTKSMTLSDESLTLALVNGTDVEPILDSSFESCAEEDITGDEPTAVITVENLDGIDGLDGFNKSIVQKYKLENGELSLEEYEDNDLDVTKNASFTIENR